MNKWDAWKPYRPGKTDSTRISRGKLDLFTECQRCFYLDRRLGIKRPSMPGWSLNSAVDALLKNEFDYYREKQQPHPLMKEYAINAVPLHHENLSEWRDDVYQFIGARYLHKPTNLEICGIVDDIWVNHDGDFIIVDYKSTSTKKELSLDDEYKQGYKKQAEIYQWIFRQNGFKVTNKCYFVFANGVKDKSMFDSQLEFEMSILEHNGDDSWVEKAVFNIKSCLDNEKIPESSPECEHCRFSQLSNKAVGVNNCD